MTARYALYTIDKLSARFAPDAGVPKGTKPSYNISPVQNVPVIVVRGGARVIETMKWGFIPSGAKDTNSVFRYKTQIARSEGIFERPAWSDAIRTKRCLIPANGFYEWRNLPDGKVPYFIQTTDQPLFAFAGIYGEWTDPDGKAWGMCALVTTNSGVDSIMTPSRLPVIVDPSDEADWLDPTIGDINTLYKIMRPYDPDKLKIKRVSDAINSVKASGADLIIPVSVSY
jgi:putative SOS response-associated peptidase YedK